MFDERSELWSQALTGFGIELTAHVLEAPQGERPADDDGPRWDVVRSLAANSIEAPGSSPEQQFSLRRFLICHPIDDHGRTLLEVCRESIEGGISPQTGDVVVDSFSRLVFHGLALECMPGSERDRFSISASFQEPTMLNPAALAFLQDEDLGRLFPGADQAPDESGRISATSLLTWLPAGGGTTYLEIVVGSFVEQTLARMRFEGQLNESAIVGFVGESLDQLRRFARREEVEVLHLTGLVGIDVESPLDRGGWGIRRSEGIAVHQPPSFSEPMPRSVLWIMSPQRLLSVAEANTDESEVNAIFDELQEHATSALMELNRRILVLRYGLLSWALDSGLDSPINVHATSEWSLLPIAQTRPPFLDPQGLHTGIATVVREEHLDHFASIVEDIGEAAPKLDIALSRIVRVASERRDPVDALIDAVVAWENMLGSKAETAFKVCAALGWLLEPDHEGRRSELFAKSKKIYSLRSDLVHGSFEADPALASEYGREALKIAARAFRIIHRDPSLRDLRSSSRSERILLRSRL